MQEKLGKEIKHLAEKFNAGTITGQELELLQQLLNEQHSEAELSELFEENNNPKIVTGTPTSLAFNRLMADPRVQQQQRNNSKIKRLFFAASTVSAACVLMLFAWLLFFDSPDTRLPRPQQVAKQVKPIQPGGPKAKIVLANGALIDLETLAADTTIQMPGYTITKSKNGLIKYEQKDAGALASIYNTIVTPAGGEYRLELADGTRIRINAASELKYPIQFDASTRDVALKGEAFFEVAKVTENGKRVPFTVTTGMQKIEVLGTSFNVNAYHKDIKTTLVEGSVRLHFKNKQVSRMLKPNQQAIFSADDQRVSIEEVDPFYSIAWTNGAFAFENASIEEVMEEISRWYDVEVDYNQDMSRVYFTGSISKYDNISKLLNTIEITGSANFKIEGRRILVMR